MWIDVGTVIEKQWKCFTSSSMSTSSTSFPWLSFPNIFFSSLGDAELLESDTFHIQAVALIPKETAAVCLNLKKKNIAVNATMKRWNCHLLSDN